MSEIGLDLATRSKKAPRILIFSIFLGFKTVHFVLKTLRSERPHFSIKITHIFIFITLFFLITGSPIYKITRWISTLVSTRLFLGPTTFSKSVMICCQKIAIPSPDEISTFCSNVSTIFWTPWATLPPGKVQFFWKGNKNLKRKSPPCFDIMYKSKHVLGDFFSNFVAFSQYLTFKYL